MRKHGAAGGSVPRVIYRYNVIYFTRNYVQITLRVNDKFKVARTLSQGFSISTPMADVMAMAPKETGACQDLG